MQLLQKKLTLIRFLSKFIALDCIKKHIYSIEMFSSVATPWRVANPGLVAG